MTYKQRLAIFCYWADFYTEYGQVIAFYQMANRCGFDSDSSKFRPIKTEREIAIEAAVDVMRSNGMDTFNNLAIALHNAGLLRSKNES